MKRNLTTVIIGALLILIFALLLFVFQVRQSEIAVVTTFSKPTGMALPGPHLKWPWPIQKVYTFDQRIQNFEDRLSEGLTKDSFTLDTMIYIGWKITDPTNFFQRFRGGAISEAENRLGDLARSAKNNVVGGHVLADFVSASGEGTKIDAIEKEILADLQSRVKDNNYGLEIEFLGIKKIGFPEAVTQAVFDRMRAERNVKVSQLNKEATTEAARIQAEANLAASKMVSDAEGQARRIKGEGEAAAAQASQVFQQNPQLASFLLRMDALESALTNRTTLIFDQSKPPFDLFNGISTNLVK
ncbi:MAG TPA: protease modulator HflC [Verrucomicrobiae bacterium]|jgi:membrane protease subunit HflC|nr:protease modulator HflC [Verrucomicrobiae bacterium]